MRCLAFIAAAALGGCGSGHTDPKLLAERCVSDQAPQGKKVSAAKSHDLVGKCRSEVRDWLDTSMRHACSGACDYSDPKIVEERRTRKEAIEQHLMMSVSDDVHPRFVRM